MCLFRFSLTRLSFLECRKNRIERRKQEDVSFNYVGFSTNDAWDSTSLENEQDYEESITSNSTSGNNNHRRLWETISQDLDSQQTRMHVTENTEMTKTHEKNSFADSQSSKQPLKNAKYQASENDTREKSTISRSNLPNTNAPRVRSARITKDQRSSNVLSTEKGKAV